MTGWTKGLTIGMTIVGLLLAGPSWAAGGDFRMLRQSTQWETPSTGILIAEAGGGLVTGSILGAGLGLGLVGLTGSFGTLKAVIPLAIGGATGFALGCPVGVWGVGTLAHQDGKFETAFYGSALGLAGGLGLGVISGGVLLPTVLVLSPVGAVIGYNRGRTGNDDVSRRLRLDLPSIGIGRTLDTEDRWQPVLDVRLVNVRL